MGDWLSSTINGATGLVTGLLAGHQAKKQREFEQAEAEKQRDWNEAMADKQNAWNLDMWNKQNEYNTPAAQKQRLLDAGLNPLGFNMDNSSATELTAAEPMGYERASAANIPNPVTAGVDAAVKIAQLSNIRADTAKKTEETETEVTRREQMQQQIENAKQQLNNMLAEEGLTKTRKAEIEKGLEWADRLNAATIAAKEAETALTKSQKKRIDELLQGEKEIQIKTLEDFDRRWKEIDARIKKYAAETGLLYEDISNYALNHASNGVFGTGLSLQNFIRLIKGKNLVNEKPTDSDKAAADAAGLIYDNK